MISIVANVLCMPRCYQTKQKLLIIKQLYKMENTKELETNKQCDMHVVTCSCGTQLNKNEINYGYKDCYKCSQLKSRRLDLKSITIEDYVIGRSGI